MLLTKDRALLEGFRRGDEAALTRVYREYSDPVAEFLARGAGVKVSGAAATLGALDVEAAHQETFVRAFRPQARAAYDALRPYLPYLLTIARSAAVDTLRSRGKIATVAVPLDLAGETVSSMPSDHASPEEAVLNREA